MKTGFIKILIPVSIFIPSPHSTKDEAVVHTNIYKSLYIN